jgi:toxin ParE1/3/4
MAPVEVELHPEAQHEAEAAYEWYADRSAQAAEGFALELDQAIFSIAENPTAWPLYLRHTRRYLLRRYPFAVVYRQKPTVVEVVAIAHARRRPGYWRSR